MSTNALKATPLNSVHRTMGAKMVDFGGWDMPVQYSGILDEHNAVRTAVGLFDVSHMGEIEFFGPDAVALADWLSTNAASRLKIGQAQYSGLLYEHGGFVDDILVHKVADDHIFICVNASNQDKDFAHMSANNPTKARVEFAGDRFAQLAIQGPKGPSTLQKLTRTRLEPIQYYHFAEGEVAGVPARIARTGYTGEDGFEIVTPAKLIEAVWNQIMSAGHAHCLQPAGLGARDTLRTEACFPLYGHELDEQTTPIEAGLGFFVSFDKGDFIGRDVLARQKAEGVARKCVAFKMTEKSAPPRPDYPIWSSTSAAGPIGKVVSGTQSPTLGIGIGLGYVPAALASPGTAIEIEIRGRRAPALVVPKPFYRKAN